ncbi:MAG: TniQ family protein [Devosia sp.]|nr:TniQ family protein [Devosia sp.]
MDWPPPRSIRLPVHVPPAPDEALPSWCCRLGASLGLAPRSLTHHLFDIDSYRDPSWWRRPSEGQFAVIAAQTGVGVDQLRAMTMDGWPLTRADGLDDRFSARRTRWVAMQPRKARSLSVCLRCLDGDEQPYIRRDWMTGWSAVCLRHRTILVDRCPACNRLLTMAGLYSASPVTPGQCGYCRHRLTGAGDQPAHDGAIDLQQRLLALQDDGIATAGLPDIPGWRTFTVLIDTTLHAVWLHAADHARERLFARVVSDLGMAADERYRIEWTANYGAFVLMSWLLADWPARFAEMLALLGAPSVEDILQGLGDVDEALNEPVRRLDGARRPTPAERGRAWLDSLPTGDALRARAWREPHWLRSNRVRVLALLRDGLSLEEVATTAKVAPRSVERWLDVGAAYGIDAVIGSVVRSDKLDAALLDRIAAWLATMPCLLTKPTYWSPEHARSEILARVGVELSTMAIREMLRQNRLHREKHLGEARRRPDDDAGVRGSDQGAAPA